MISVVVIASNEEAAIGGCLASVAWADEIVVLDCGSTDDTVGICQGAGARVISTDWPGFGPQKNRAIACTTGEWVLSLDADERVTAPLHTEIQRAVASPGETVAFRMPRASRYLGRRMYHSGWWPDHVTRLFRRGRARFSEDVVHERLIVDGPVSTLSAPIEHEAFVSLEEVLAKIDSYSTLGAARMQADGRRGSLRLAVGHALWTFVRTYSLRRGFLDGREGFMLAVSNAEGAYYRHLKLMLLGRKGPRRER